MINTDIGNIFAWWLFLFLIGFSSIPITYVIFNKFSDFGYGLSKTIGILLTSYFFLILNEIKILPFTDLSLLILMSLYFLINIAIFAKNKSIIIDSFKQKFKAVVLSEILFTFGLILWAYIRSFQPNIEGLEKLMDYGFVNSILRSKFLPPKDMWLAGQTINYYWFGHYITAFLSKITNVQTRFSYNLMLGTILGISLSSVFSITSSLINTFSKKTNSKMVLIGGIVSALLVSFAGNFHSPFYLIKNGWNSYWYPDATRFIGYNPDTEDKTIHEFPIYSYTVSDLHGHLLDLIVVFAFLATLFVFLDSGKNKKYIPLVGFLLGIMYMTNTWDFGNYLLATGFALLVFYIKDEGIKLKSFLKIAANILSVIAFGLAFALPFILNFNSIAQGISFTNHSSPLWQLMILWGFPAVLSLIFLPIFFKNKEKAVVADFFIISILISSWVLIAIPEIIFVKDIYISSYQRANTMFKLTYQAFVMFYLSSGYIIFRSINLCRKYLLKTLLAILFIICCGSISIYPYIAVKSYYQDLKNYRGLDGELWLRDEYPGVYSAIVWLKTNSDGNSVIMEAPGDSYTKYNVISSYTGIPTVIGWFVHEWLWRGTAEIPQERSNEVAEAYTSQDINKLKSLISKYQITYIIVGPFERQKYPNINISNIKNAGRSIFSFADTTIYKVE